MVDGFNNSAFTADTSAGTLTGTVFYKKIA